MVSPLLISKLKCGLDS